MIRLPDVGKIWMGRESDTLKVADPMVFTAMRKCKFSDVIAFVQRF